MRKHVPAESTNELKHVPAKLGESNLGSTATTRRVKQFAKKTFAFRTTGPWPDAAVTSHRLLNMDPPRQAPPAAGVSGMLPVNPLKGSPERNPPPQAGQGFMLPGLP